MCYSSYSRQLCAQSDKFTHFASKSKRYIVQNTTHYSSATYANCVLPFGGTQFLDDIEVQTVTFYAKL